MKRSATGFNYKLRRVGIKYWVTGLMDKNLMDKDDLLEAVEANRS
jgi:hypothetical protein